MYKRTVIEYYWYKVDVDGEIKIIKSATRLAYKDILRDIYSKVTYDKEWKMKDTPLMKERIKRIGIDVFTEKYCHRVKKAWVIDSGYYYWEE